MRRYVVVAAVRIQQWLARTPRLALIRGASRGLAEATSKKTIDGLLAGHGLAKEGKVAEDAGDVDGVIVIEMTGGSIDNVRRVVRDHVRGALPGLEWTVWDGEVADVFAALTASKDHSELVLAERMTVPFAQRCQGCGTETAARRRTVAEDDLWLGPDCLTRWSDGRSGGPAGRSYRDRLHVPGERPPATMRDLARAKGSTEESANRYGGKRNHVAVVCADGNSIGELFGSIPQQHRATAVGALDAATRDAVTSAAVAVTAPVAGADRDVAVEPHFVGGDDILVSVPAPLAWAFALHLAQAFESLLGDYLATVMGDQKAAASLGVGLCFSHEAYPFAHAREVAFAAMKEAKKAVRGRSAAVGWADLTAEDQAVPGRYRTLERLLDLRHGYALGGDLVVAATNAARGEMAAEIDPGGGRFGTAARAVDRLANQARRGNDKEFEDWLTSGEPPEELIADLRSGISLARWWPGTLAAQSASGAVAHTGGVRP